MTRRMTWNLKKQSLIFGLILVSIFSGARAFASADPILNSIETMIKDLRGDIPIIQTISDKIALAQITSSGNLSIDERRFTQSRLLAAFSQTPSIQLLNCRECELVTADSQGDDIVVSKGPKSQDDLARIGTNLGVNSFLKVNLTQTTSRVIMDLQLVSASSGKLLWSKSYESPVINLGGASFRGGVTLGQGIADHAYPVSIEIRGTERILGVGELGLSFNYLFAQGEYSRYICIGPTLGLSISDIFSFPHAMGAMYLRARGGYGLYSGSNDLNAGFGFRWEPTQIFHLSIDYLKGFGLPASNPANTLPYFPGALILGFGFSLG